MVSATELEKYRRRIAEIHWELGIPDSYRTEIGLPLQIETNDLAPAGLDIFERPQQLTPETFARWLEIRAAAARDNIQLAMVSAFRSVDHQRRIIQRKLGKGQSIKQILAVNAAPGYSEHHTGKAIDIATPDCEPLCEAFETTPAFVWLTANAGRHGFVLSYPRDNPFALVYEPWHWALRQTGPG